jgi:hypothetical protein
MTVAVGATDRGSRRRLRDGLIVPEVALAFVLLVGSWLMMRSFFGMLTVDPGLDPTKALQLAWALEHRGATFSVEGENLVVEGPRGFLTEPDLAAIRRWRAHLKSIATYHAPAVIE